MFERIDDWLDLTNLPGRPSQPSVNWIPGKGQGEMKVAGVLLTMLPIER